MTITGLHHVLLTVSDLDRSVGFYRDVLGLQIFKQVPDDGVAGSKVIFTLPDGTFFAVVHHPDGDFSPFDEKRIGADHVSFNVSAAELGAWEERLREAGLTVAPPAPSASGEMLLVFRDPDGIQLQIYGRAA